MAIHILMHWMLALKLSWLALTLGIVKLHGYKELLTDILKTEMQFDGFVVGDWNGHGQVEECSNAKCAQSFNAGVDMFMVPENWKDLLRNTIRQVKLGEISEARLDEAVRNILTVKSRLGLFNGRILTNSR